LHLSPLQFQRFNESIFAAAKNRSEIRKEELIELLKGALSSLTTDQIAEIFGSITG